MRFERAVLERERKLERSSITSEDIDSTGIHIVESSHTANDVERCAALRSRFGENQCAVREIKRGEIVATRNFRANRQWNRPAIIR